MSGIRWVQATCLVLCVGLVAVACDTPESTMPVDTQPSFTWTPYAGNGIVDDEQAELCKVDGPVDGTWFNVEVRSVSTGDVRENYDIKLLPGDCFVVWGEGGTSEIVTVTEMVPAGFSTPMWEKTQCIAPAGLGDRCREPGTIIDVTSGVGTQVTGVVGGDGGDDLHEGVLWVFTNVPGEATGRMTGGLVKLANDVKITGGFTIHCDITLSNNLEVNWPDNSWHLDKPITSALCTDDPAVAPEPPPAPFDTFEGTGVGRLNGVDGASIWFVFQDAGQPGGKNDKVAIKIWDAGGNLVLDVPFDFTEHGNLQAHYDQPHGCNVNKPC